MRNWDWIAGVVVVTGMVLGFAGLLGFGIWDVVRQFRHDPGASEGNLSITASVWILDFAFRHPIVLAFGFLSLGILVGHLLWPQTRRE